MNIAFRTFLCLLIMTASATPQALPPAGAPTAPREVSYRLEMPEPSDHIFRVSISLTDLASTEEYVDLVLPVWRPGRYVVLDFAGGVLRFDAMDGADHPLNWEKTDKSTWRVHTVGVTGFTASYEVYADEFDVRTRGLNAEHGFIDATAVFMYSEKYRNLPVRLTVTPPPGWHVTTGLDGKGNVFTSPGYDHFADCPVEIGTQTDIDFTVRGVPHVLSIFGEAGWNTDTLIRDISKIVEATADFWGDMPYDRYVFLVHLAPWAGGATEHFNSTIIGARPERVITPDGYRGFLSTVAHEYFHTWNVKRLRPKGIVPYDYTRENYTRELWIAEGMTSYFDDLLMVRAGLNPPEKYVKSRASWVSGDRRRPGNGAQSLSESSFDAWIKYNKGLPHSYNTQTDFYSKGSQVSFMLDMTIRRLTENAHSLDGVMRLMYERFPFSGPGYTVDDLQATASEVAGKDLSEFFQNYVHGTEPLPWEEMLSVAGISVSVKDSTPKPWIGIATRTSGSKTTVSTIASGSPAAEAGLDIGDEIVAVDGARLPGNDLNKAVSAKKPGETMKVAVFRDDRLREFDLTVRESPVPDYTTELIDGPTDLQKRTFEEWLHASWAAGIGGLLTDTTRRNVFIIVIDGIRFSEAFPMKDTVMPHMWNDLRPRGTIFNNFRNEGRTVTCPGHASFLTGEYEDLANDGSMRPTKPTLFEFFRSEKGLPEHACYDVAGKKKLHMLAYSTDPKYGKEFGAVWKSPEHTTDTATWTLLSGIMDRDHPRLVIVNFPSVDIAGHDSSWTGYLGAMRTADSLVYILWNKIQSDDFYRDRTTMFVSSDHGRHGDEWGGFQHHGCPCEGCRHIIGLGVGPGFAPGAVVEEALRQTDVQAAAAELLSISIPDRGAGRILTQTP